MLMELSKQLMWHTVRCAYIQLCTILPLKYSHCVTIIVYLLSPTWSLVILRSSMLSWHVLYPLGVC